MHSSAPCQYLVIILLERGRGRRKGRHPEHECMTELGHRLGPWVSFSGSPQGRLLSLIRRFLAGSGLRCLRVIGLNIILEWERTLGLRETVRASRFSWPQEETQATGSGSPSGCAYSRSGRNPTACKSLRFDQQNEGCLQPRHRRTGRQGRSNHRRHLCLTKQVFPRGARADGKRGAGPFARLQRGLPRRTFSSLFPSLAKSRKPDTESLGIDSR